MSTTTIETSIPAAEAVLIVRERGAGHIIDVRTPMEVASEHIAGSHHINMEDLLSRLEEVHDIPGPRYLLCRSGKRAEMARHELSNAGLDHLIVIEGGILAYAAAGGETVKGKERMSLERQVRIAAGLMIVASVALGFLVHPLFHGVAGFMGAGLAFAGITDTCGMGLMLAKMPWNKA